MRAPSRTGRERCGQALIIFIKRATTVGKQKLGRTGVKLPNARKLSARKGGEGTKEKVVVPDGGWERGNYFPLDPRAVS